MSVLLESYKTVEEVKQSMPVTVKTMINDSVITLIVENPQDEEAINAIQLEGLCFWFYKVKI